MKKAYIVTDLGGGDGGKGGVVHKICDITNAHTVVKVGGAQGSHGVRTANGQSFNFSHMGCGTFNGASTHISDKMVIDPISLLYEAKLLQYSHGERDIFDRLTVDEDALCVTYFHQIASRLRELHRKENPKGTIGLGIGEAVNDAELRPDLALRVKDVGRDDLAEILDAVRVQKLRDLQQVICGNFWDQDRPQAIELIKSLSDDTLPFVFAKKWQEMSQLCKIVPHDYLAYILSRDGAVVFESSHGILTDRYYGFHPHTTKLRTLPSLSLDLLKECSYDGEVKKIGVTRAYQIRHGAGPMVTHDPRMTDKLLPGSSKGENRWQGKVRVGPLDFVALRYAINVCGGPEFFDGLAVTWFDQLNTEKEWLVCNRYTEPGNLRFFTPDREIRVRPESEPDPLDYQERLGKILYGCKPVLTSVELPHAEDLESRSWVCAEVMHEHLKVPVKMIGFGPTEDDKVCL